MADDSWFWSPLDLLDPLIDWFLKNIGTLIDNFFDSQIVLLNKLIEWGCVAIDFGISFLPSFTLPTLGQISEDSQVMGFINWFIPFDILASILTVWLASEIGYIVVAPVLRWLKLIAR